MHASTTHRLYKLAGALHGPWQGMGLDGMRRLSAPQQVGSTNHSDSPPERDPGLLHPQLHPVHGVAEAYGAQ